MSTPLVSPCFDRLLFHSEHISVGSFRAAASHPRFQDSGPAPAHLIVFPRTAVAIQHEGKAGFIAGAPVVTLYNEGQRYRRSVISPLGDQCEWFALSSSFAAHVLPDLDPRYDGNPATPFRVSHGPSSNQAYLAQRRFVQQRLAGRVISEMEAEEFAIALVGLVLPHALAVSIPHERARQQRQREQVEAAKQLLLLGAHDLNIQTLAERVNSTAFHLCRSFKRHTGISLHTFSEQARLRAALERLEQPAGDLSELAFALGYSSHSHFSYAFRKCFDLTPGRFREFVKRRGFSVDDDIRKVF
jgi:AraC-like DNA-binding protein